MEAAQNMPGQEAGTWRWERGAGAGGWDLAGGARHQGKSHENRTRNGRLGKADGGQAERYLSPVLLETNYG